MTKKIGLFLLLALSISCSNAPTADLVKSRLTLASVEKLKIQETSMSQAEEVFGKPSMIVPLEQGRSAWLYLEGKVPTTRLSLIFKDQNQKLAEANWFVEETDSESDFSKVRERYPEAHFIKSEPEWTNSHIGPDFLLYSDSKLNLKIVFQKTTKKVSGIRWEAPDSANIRKPSSKFEF